MIEKFKAYWSLLKETHSYLLRPRRIGRLLDRLYTYREFIGDMDAETWKDKVVQSLKDELDARKKAMDEEEQAHEAAEEELRVELDRAHKRHIELLKLLDKEHSRILELLGELAKAKAERAAALAEKAYLLAEKAEWLKEGDPYRVPSETAPSNC